MPFYKQSQGSVDSDGEGQDWSQEDNKELVE